MPSPPEDADDEQTRDVYAHFGLAMFLAQCLEHGLVNALIFAKLLPNEAAAHKGGHKVFDRSRYEARFDIFLEKQFKETIGSLITLLRRATAVPTDLEAALMESKEKRNFLAHHYFRDRDEQFISRVGRDAMIAELEDAQRLFQRTDDQLNTAVEPLMRKAGLTPEVLDQIEADILLRAHAKARAIDAAFGPDAKSGKSD